MNHTPALIATREPITHELKTWPEYFDAVKRGGKTFEVRTDDRDFQVGDTLILMEWRPDAEYFTGREVTRKISYVMKGGTFGVKEGFVVIGLEREQFDPCWPAGLKQGEVYKVLCDDKGRKGGSWLQVYVAPDGDVHVSMQDWENVPEGSPDPLPSIRVRTGIGGGRNQRTRQALLWLAEAIRLDGEEQAHRQGGR